MALFAKRLAHCSFPRMYVDGYCTIISIAKKKGGSPISYIVYFGGRARSSEHFMGSFFSLKDALKVFKGFNTTSPALQFHSTFRHTTAWLNEIAIGGSATKPHNGIWMRVSTPRIGSRKRGRKPPLFGDIGLLCRIAKAEEFEAHEMVRAIELRLVRLTSEYDESESARELVLADIAMFEAEKESATDVWRCAYNRYAGVRCEMEFVRSKRTGIPISKNSWSQTALAKASSAP